MCQTHREYKLKYVLDYEQNTLITKCCPLGWECDLVQCLPGASSSNLYEPRTASLLQRSGTTRSSSSKPAQATRDPEAAEISQHTSSLNFCTRRGPEKRLTVLPEDLGSVLSTHVG